MTQAGTDTRYPEDGQEERAARIAGRFLTRGAVVSARRYGSGHINDTLLLTCRQEDGTEHRYVLQRMNEAVFKNPAELMENVVNVTDFLRKKIIARGGDPDRETMNVIHTREGANYLLDEEGKYWRMYAYVEDTDCLDEVRSPEDFYNSAVAFGNFQRMLSDYPAATLHETIPNFHNTVSRLKDLKRAVREDALGRADGVREEIAFILEREADTHVICDALAEGRLPLRVTHNDTKLNNVGFDRQTGKGICVFDLDTVMPGSALYDYGDSIRFGASTAAEDEQDLCRVSCSLELFDIYTKGYIEGCGGSLTKEELALLPMGAKLMTLECGMRFLEDYLKGDGYFRIHRPGQNLDRARTQLKLVWDMERKWEQLCAITAKYC